MSKPRNDGSFYSDKTILAPMVRAGRTPLRLLALEYGADLVYTEEIVDQKILSSKRIVNDILHTIDYVIEDDVVLRIATERERERCVLQVGTNSAERIAEVAAKVCNDVAAIDVNMGCPKPFSIMGGMGAALLTQPDKVKDILTSLVSVSSVPVSCKIRVLDKVGIPISRCVLLGEFPKCSAVFAQILTSLVSVSSVPVSCKIRVLDKQEDTLALVKLIEKCGVTAIGVHGRRRDERQGDANRVEEIREVARALSIPVIANGGSGTIKEFKDIEQFRTESGASSVMLARRALSNPSIFRPEGLLTMQEEITSFLRLACEFDENFTMMKYVVQRILGNQQIKLLSDFHALSSVQSPRTEFHGMGVRRKGNQPEKGSAAIVALNARYCDMLMLTLDAPAGSPNGWLKEFDARGRATVVAASVLDICDAWSMRNVYENFKSNRQRGHKRKVVPDAETGIHFIDLTFPPKRLRDKCGATTPKCVLNSFCDECGIKRPVYCCKFRPVDKRFEALVEVDGRKFLSRIGQPNKKMAEQVAALAALVGLDKRGRLSGHWEE
ncbi:tRNA-dihydrouridine(20) synthase [NAD(P)+]-like [Toxocara canis]|uniref:tRNA-dihydrouridine(20) synthase [NAD(P)+]-like n=1 Tax=Toxocara canis TaxID=6265 RepID=A0A0B2V0Y9_TOXCA|nr:tRNA-dihydrouridine(20) synthase [NAD(P)+]-like [Toxocara canis]